MVTLLVIWGLAATSTSPYLSVSSGLASAAAIVPTVRLCFGRVMAASPRRRRA
jgi:hypothetical protein